MKPYTKPKSHLTIEQDGKITILTRRVGERVNVKLSDTGIGIPEKVLQDIWEYGYTRKNSDLSTGIGLAVAKRIVEEHDGEIEVTNNPDQRGVTFNILFPAL